MNEARVRFALYALATGVVAALLIGGGVTYQFATGHGGDGTNVVYQNQTVFRNSTVFQNTTTNGTSHWSNTTVFVNTTSYTNSTVWHNETVYVNVTYVIEIPVVNVTFVEVNYTSPSLGENETLSVLQNYSLPVGTVTWVGFSVSSMCGHDGTFAVNAPWVLLESSYESGREYLLIGVPYFPGTYGLDVTVSV